MATETINGLIPHVQFHRHDGGQGIGILRLPRRSHMGYDSFSPRSGSLVKRIWRTLLSCSVGK